MITTADSYYVTRMAIIAEGDRLYLRGFFYCVAGGVEPSCLTYYVDTMGKQTRCDILTQQTWLVSCIKVAESEH